MSEVNLDMSGERCDPCYGLGWNASTEYHLARYRLAARRASAVHVLDVACGLGYGSRMLAESGASGVLGLDLSRDAIAEACRRYAAPGLGFRVDNAEEMNSLSPQDQFGLIVSFETIEHLPRPEEFLKRVRTHLSHDGVFFVSTPWRSEGCLEDKPSNPYHVREWDLSEFALLLGGFFSDIRWHVQGLPFREQPHSIVAVVLETLRRLGTKLSGRGWPSSQCHEIVPVPNLRGLQPSFSNPTFIVAEARR